MGRQDHKVEKLAIPPNTALEVVDGAVSLTFAGDIVLSGPLTGQLGRVICEEGSILLRGPLTLGDVIARSGAVVVDGAVTVRSIQALAGPITLSGEVHAEEIRSPAGSVSMHGSLDCGQIHAAEELIVEGDLTARLVQGGFIRLNSGAVNVKGIEGTVRAELGAAKLAVEVIIAPEVQVGPECSGRVNVVESVNELAPNGLKGGFRLHEYAEFTGVDPARFLEERGVRPLATLSSPSVVVRGGPLSTNDDRTLGGDLEEEELSELDLEPVELAPPPPISVEPPTPPAPEPQVDPALRKDFDAIAAKIRGAYTTGEEPPPVLATLAMLDAADYAGLKDNLTELWNQLVPWYQQRQRLIPYAVISSFNGINSLLRKL